MIQTERWNSEKEKQRVLGKGLSCGWGKDTVKGRLSGRGVQKWGARSRKGLGVVVHLYNPSNSGG